MTLIDTNSVSISFDSSMMGTNGGDMVAMYKDFYMMGQADAGIVGIDHIHRSGHGRVARMTFVTIDNISGKKESAAIIGESLNFFVHGAKAIDPDGDLIELQPGQDSIVVWDIDNAIAQLGLSQEIKLYPNPAKDLVRVDAGSVKVLELRLYDSQGRIVARRLHSEALALTDLPNGVYFLQVNTDIGITRKKLVVLH